MPEHIERVDQARVDRTLTSLKKTTIKSHTDGSNIIEESGIRVLTTNIPSQFQTSVIKLRRKCMQLEAMEYMEKRMQILVLA